MRRRLARGLLVSAAGSWIAWGCLLSPPPDISGPVPGRPNVNMSQVVPPTYQLLTAEHGSSLRFTLPVISEDAGEDLWALVWVNWNLEGEYSYSTERFAPSVDAGMGGAGSTERSISLNWGPDGNVASGCNQLTIFLVHDRYADLTEDLPSDFNKAAMLTWWVNVDPATGAERDLIDCPGPKLPNLTSP